MIKKGGCLVMDCKCKLPFSDAHLSKLNYILNYKMMECPKFKIGNWLYISISFKIARSALSRTRANCFENMMKKF